MAKDEEWGLHVAFDPVRGPVIVARHRDENATFPLVGFLTHAAQRVCYAGPENVATLADVLRSSASYIEWTAAQVAMMDAAMKAARPPTENETA